MMIDPCVIDGYHGLCIILRIGIAYEIGASNIIAMAIDIFAIISCMDLSIRLSDDQSTAHTIVTITCGIITY